VNQQRSFAHTLSPDEINMVTHELDDNQLSLWQLIDSAI